MSYTDLVLFSLGGQSFESLKMWSKNILGTSEELDAEGEISLIVKKGLDWPEDTLSLHCTASGA